MSNLPGPEYLRQGPGRSLLAILLSLLLSGCAAQNSFEFAVLGDNPYDDATMVRYQRMIDQVNAHPELAWIVHLGDVKGGSQSCADELLQARFELNQQFNAPFILTPGDNDWFDCDRPSAGRYEEFERLGALRKIFYPDPSMSSGQNPMPVISQANASEFSEFIENVRWEKSGVVFATVHVLSPTRPPSDPAAMARKMAAAEVWIREAFRTARETGAKGLFLAMQADPWVVWGLPGLLNMLCERCGNDRPGLEWLYPLLREQTLAFGKPVVLAVGDTHVYRVDKPLYTDEGELLTNFTRLEPFGFPDVHWIRVVVEPDTTWVFSFRQQITD